MSAETGSIGMEAMSFSAPAVEAMASPAETIAEISSTPIIDISNSIHPYAGATSEPTSIIDKSSFEDFPNAFEIFSDEKSVFPTETLPYIDLSAPTSPFAEIGQTQSIAEKISDIQNEIPSAFYDAFAEPTIENTIDSTPEENSIIREIQDAVFEPHFDIPLVSDSHTQTEISQQISDTAINEPAISLQELTEAFSKSQITERTQTQPDAYGKIEIQTKSEVSSLAETESETQTQPKTSAKTEARLGIEATDEITSDQPPVGQIDKFVIDEGANGERMTDAKEAIDDVFGLSEHQEIIGTQITSIMGATPEIDEISQILKDRTNTLEDGSYKELIEALAERTFQTKEEALIAVEKLLREKPAVTVSTEGVPVSEEDVERVEEQGKPSRESVIFEGK